MVLLVGVCSRFEQVKQVINNKDNGRFSVWQKAVTLCHNGIEIKQKNVDKIYHKKCNLLGFGSGSWNKLVPYKMVNEDYNYAHNEYLQIYFEFGIVVLVLFVFFLSQSIFTGHDKYTRAAVLCICLNAAGLFVWQLGPTLFASIYVLCLNKGSRYDTGSNS